MNRTGRAGLLLAFVVAMLTVVNGPGASPANAATGYTTTCSSPNYGYSCVSYSGYTGQSTWGYPVDWRGHNCTNYLAYRLAQNGAANPGNLGNANNWDNNAAAKGFRVDGTPAVGAVAQWEGYAGPAISAEGHVAYVETVTDTYIDISQDSWGGTTSTARIARGGTHWPSHFIHIKDKPGAVSDGSFVSHHGFVYRIAGGAPVYVSSWDAVGGSQPSTPLTDAQFAALRQYPVDGTVVSVKSGHVYRFAGGAPLYVSNWNAIGGSKPAIRVDQAAIDQGGNPAEPWRHVRKYPADGTYVSVNQGWVYVFAGGAPIYVTNWNAVGGSRPSTLVDQAALDQGGNPSAPWNHVSQYPADGTLVTVTEGYVYKYAGGAPIYVSSFDAIGGAAPATRVDRAALDHGGSSAPWDHTRLYPVDGTTLTPLGGESWVVRDGIARSQARTPGALVDRAAIDNAGLGAPWNHLRSSTPQARLKTLPETTRDRVTLRWTQLITSSKTTAYDLRWRLGGGEWQTPATWSGLAAGPIEKSRLRVDKTYCFSIRAHNAAGLTGPWSRPRCSRTR